MRGKAEGRRRKTSSSKPRSHSKSLMPGLSGSTKPACPGRSLARSMMPRICWRMMTPHLLPSLDHTTRTSEARTFRRAAQV